MAERRYFELPLISLHLPQCLEHALKLSMQMDKERDQLWIFNGEQSRFPSGVFTSVAAAEIWISQHKLSGVLTQYPIDIGAYDFAVEKGLLKPQRDEQKTPAFIGKFSCSGFEHYHYENGSRD